MLLDSREIGASIFLGQESVKAILPTNYQPKKIFIMKKSYLEREYEKLQRKVERFNNKLIDFNQETGDSVATLYEDICTHFTLTPLKLELEGVVPFFDDETNEDISFNSYVLTYEYDGSQELVNEPYEEIVEYIKFYDNCLKRAIRYWKTNPEVLDAMADGEMEDIEEE